MLLVAANESFDLVIGGGYRRGIHHGPDEILVPDERGEGTLHGPCQGVLMLTYLREWTVERVSNALLVLGDRPEWPVQRLL